MYYVRITIPELIVKIWLCHYMETISTATGVSPHKGLAIWSCTFATGVSLIDLLLSSCRSSEKPCPSCDVTVMNELIRPVCSTRNPQKCKAIPPFFCSSAFVYGIFQNYTLSKHQVHTTSHEMFRWFAPLQWRNNDCDGVWNHQPHDCLLNTLFRGRSHNISKLRVTSLCEGNHRTKSQ